MPLDTGEDDEKFGEVELAAHPNAGSHFFLEHTSGGSLFSSLPTLFAFSVIHSYSSIRAPPTLVRREQFFRMNATGKNVSMEVDLTLAPLQRGHRFVSVNGSLVSNKTGQEWSLPLDVTVRRTRLNNGGVIGHDPEEKRKLAVHWTADCRKSSFFGVGRVLVGGADAIRFKITVDADYRRLQVSNYRVTLRIRGRRATAGPPVF
jgi:hypothetical protein